MLCIISEGGTGSAWSALLEIESVSNPLATDCTLELGHGVHITLTTPCSNDCTTCHTYVSPGDPTKLVRRSDTTGVKLGVYSTRQASPQLSNEPLVVCAACPPGATTTTSTVMVVVVVVVVVFGAFLSIPRATGALQLW